MPPRKRKAKALGKRKRPLSLDQEESESKKLRRTTVKTFRDCCKQLEEVDLSSVFRPSAGSTGQSNISEDRCISWLILKHGIRQVFCVFNLHLRVPASLDESERVQRIEILSNGLVSCDVAREVISFTENACPSLFHKMKPPRRVNPTSVIDEYWVHARASPHLATTTLGKWLVFRKFSCLDSTWHEIREAVETGELGANGAKCSTAKDNPNAVKPKKGEEKEGVICVYTSEESMDSVGMKLISMVKTYIHYKTNEATSQGKYSCKGDKKITIKIIYWNDGNPSFEKKIPKIEGQLSLLETPGWSWQLKTFNYEHSRNL